MCLRAMKSRKTQEKEMGMFRKWIGPLAIALLAVSTGVARAQDQSARSVEGRLPGILKEKGGINGAQYDELRDLEKTLRKESNLETEVSARVDEMVARVAQDAPRVSYKQGSGFPFNTPDGNFQLSVGGRVQTRFTAEFRDKNGPNPTGLDTQNFSAERIRVWLKGFAFDPKLKYEIQFDASGDVDRKSTRLNSRHVSE